MVGRVEHMLLELFSFIARQPRKSAQLFENLRHLSAMNTGQTYNLIY
jgi:hypothetical protein